jgi:hypothetical protein
MEQKKWILSVRFWHPALHAEEITKNIKGIPCVAHTAGEHFITPSGKVMDKINKETYVVYDFKDDLDNYLEDAIETANAFLNDNIEYYNDFKESGGRCEYYITIVSEKCFSFVLEPEIINNCAKLGVKIWVEL